MDEDFELDGRMRGGDGLEFGERGLAFEDHAFYADLVCDRQPGGVVDAGLRGCVDGQAREIVAEHGDDSEVLHDDGVRMHAVEFGEHLRGFRDLALLDERVQRHVELPAVFVGVADHASHFVRREVAGALAGVEAFEPGIHGVRSGVVGGEGAGSVSGGGEKFRFVRHEFFHNEIIYLWKMKKATSQLEKNAKTRYIYSFILMI